MKYWIIALPRPRMEYCIRVGVFGLKRKYLLGRVEAGDKVVCYATKEAKVIALGTVTEGYYLDDTPVFNDSQLFGGDSEVYPDRFNFEAKKLPLKNEVDFSKLIPEMKFIKNPAHWSVYFSSGIAEIFKADWEAIVKEASIAAN